MGAGPAALCITAELVQQGLDVQAIASKSPLEPWPILMVSGLLSLSL